MAPRFELRRSADRFALDAPGVSSRYSFSFGPFYDPANIHHGVLLANNEERVAVGSGFPDHPHRNAEIVTWVLSGGLVHEDSRGNRGLVHRGLAQRMSAGSGIVHTERNDGYREDPLLPPTAVHFVQMWLMPDEPDLEPSYEQRDVALSDLRNHWLPVASGNDADAAIKIGTSAATLFVSVLPAGVSRALPRAPLLHLQVVRGRVHAEEVGELTEGDAVRIMGEGQLRLSGLAEAELLVWAMS